MLLSLPRNLSLYLLLATAVLMSRPVHSRVIMDSSCNLTEDMYVLAFDNARQNASVNMAIETLQGVYDTQGSYPSYMQMDTWAQMKGYHKYHFNREKKTRLAVLIDTYSQNISLMVTSDHKEQDMTWVTDNMIFIDGKTNAYADFRCSGDWIQLKWNGRDLSNPLEHFDTSDGFLSAKLEHFTNGANQSDNRLRVARLDLSYPRSGVSGWVSHYYESWVNGVSPHPHEFHYQANLPQSRPMVMSGKYRPGYQNLSELRLNFDTEKLMGMDDESSAQNPLSPSMPVSPSTARAYLHHVKHLMVNHTSEYMRSMYSSQGLHSLVDQADQSLQQSMESRGKERHAQLHNASKQMNELASRRRQINDMARSSMDGHIDRMVPQQHADNIGKQVDMMLEHVARKLKDEAHRTEHMKAYQAQQVEVDGSLIDSSQLMILEPDLFGDEPLDNLAGGMANTSHLGQTGQKPPANVDALNNCLMTQNQEGVFGYLVNDRHYGFDVGIEISLLGNSEWLVGLESTRTPWTLPLIHTYGSNYQVPAGDTWCRGPFFGVDHARDNIHLTIRGIYDPMNNSMYVVSLWSIWDKSRVFGAAQSAVTALALPGVILAGAMLTPYISVPAALALVAGTSSALLMATPRTAPEARWPHIRHATRIMAEYGLGDKFYTGNGRMQYYSSFSTLKPKGNID